MTKALVLSHRDVAHELGHLGDWLAARGIEVTRRFREYSEPWPEADVLIVLGSPGSVALGHCAQPGLEEIDAVGSWIGSGRPYLGICFGAQALAVAIGGRVERMTEADRGWMRLDTGDDAATGPHAAQPDACLEGPWMVWHEDALTAPPGARVRLRSKSADQAFSIGRAWGVQFHPELTSASLTRMATRLGAPEDAYQALVTAMAADEEGHRVRAMRLFDVWAGDVGLPTSVA